MDYVKFVTIIGMMAAGFCFIYKELKTFEKDLRDDIKIQSARSDKLYENFCDLLKLRRDP